MNKEIFFSLILTLMFTGCVSLDTKGIVKSMYNVPETGVSDFDGTKYIRMKNLSCIKKDVGLLLDLYQDTKMAKENIVILTLKVTGYHSIADGSSLHFNIDGEIINLKTMDNTTAIEEVYHSIYQPGYVGRDIYIPSVYSPAVQASTKRYVITDTFVDKVANSKKAVIKVDLARSYVEGICSPQESDVWDKNNEWLKEYTGTYGFKTFLGMMRSVNVQ